MKRINSLEELKNVRDNAKLITSLRVAGENHERTLISVGMSTCGIVAGAKKTMSILLDIIEAEKLDNVSVVATKCFGFCCDEPTVEVTKFGEKPVLYKKVHKELAEEIIKKHIMNGEILSDSVIRRAVD